MYCALDYKRTTSIGRTSRQVWISDGENKSDDRFLVEGRSEQHGGIYIRKGSQGEGNEIFTGLFFSVDELERERGEIL